MEEANTVIEDRKTWEYTEEGSELFSMVHSWIQQIFDDVDWNKFTPDEVLATIVHASSLFAAQTRIEFYLGKVNKKPALKEIQKERLIKASLSMWLRKEQESA